MTARAPVGVGPAEIIFGGAVWVQCASCGNIHEIWVNLAVERKMFDDQGRYSGPCPPRPGVTAKSRIL